MKRCRNIVGALLLATLAACKPALPSGVLSEGKLERVLHDFHLAQGMTDYVPREDNQSYDALRYELQQAVFRKHGITQEEFDRSMAYYLSDMERLVAIYKNVSTRLEREAEALGVAAGPHDIYASLTADGDTANVWANRTVFAIRNSKLDNFQMWSLSCDTTWLPGDDLMWRFSIQQVTNGFGHGDLYADLVVTYTNDSVRSKLTSVTSQTEMELRVNNPKDWIPKTVSGHFYSPLSEDPQQVRLYIASAHSLIRFHKPQEDKSSEDEDTLVADSAAESRSLHDTTDTRRLSPSQLRDLQPVDRTIDVVKEKPYQRQKRGNKKHFVTPKRQK